MTYEQFIAALCLWREGRGSSKAALAGVYAVIRNRAADPAHRWSRSIPGVILQPWQFSSFNAGDPNAVKFPMPPAPGAASPDWNAWLDCCAVVEAPIGADPTDGATGYHSFPEGDPHTPSWADPARHTCDIGAFHFFKV